MTASELKFKVDERGGKFFSRENMKVFGDTMKNYGVRETTINTWTDENPVDVYELYRRKPVKCGLSNSAFFRKEDFTQTFPKKEE
jgi:hypothetical protein